MTRLKLNLYLLLCLFLGFSFTSTAQDYHIENLLTVENGLPSNETYASFFDETGDLFILTDKGLAHYNGESTKVLTKVDGLPSTAVFKHFRDYKGRDWLTTSKGVCYLENGKIITPEFNNQLKQARYFTPINNMYVTENDSVFITSEKFLGGYFKAKIGYPGCVLHHVGIPPRQLPISRINNNTHSLRSLIFVKYKENRVISCGRSHEELKDSVTLMKEKNNLAYIHNSATSDFTEKYQLLLDSNGVPAFFFYKNSLYRCTPTMQPKLIKRFEKEILFIKQLQNKIYICLRKGGVVQMNLSTKKSRTFLSNMSIAHLNFKNPFEFYAASLESGLLEVNISYDPLFSLPMSLDLNLCVKPLYFDGQTLSIIEGFKIRQYKYIANDLHLFNEKSFTTIHREKYYYNTSWVNQDSVVFGGHNLSLKTGKSIPTPATQSHTFFSNFSNHMFGYGENGLMIFNLKETLYNSSKFGFEIPVTSITEKNLDTLFFGTAEGVFQATGLTQDTPSIKPMWLSGVSINALLYLDNSLVVATEGKGIYIYQKESFQHIDANSGLDASSAFQLLEQNDTVWVSTNTGIVYLHKPQNTPLWQVGSTAVSGNIFRLHKGEKAIYFRKNRTFFKLVGVYKSPQGLPQLKILLEKNPLTNENFTSPLKLKNNRKSFTIQYRLNELINSNRQLYQYRLLGLNEKWIETRAREINYNNLPFGEYTLQIKGKGSLGKWSEVRELGVQVIPLFYQRGWFAPVMYVIAGLLLGLLVYARQIQKSKRLKDRNLVLESSLTNLKLQINPHFIFNALNSLQYLILSNKKNESAKFLTQFSQLVRDILTSSEQQFVDLEEEVHRLKTYIDLEETRLEAKYIGFSISNETGYALNRIKIPSLLLQPLIENSIWHGFSNAPRPPELQLRFYIDTDKKLTIEITDNGVGVDLEQLELNKNNGSLAIRNIEERLYLLSKIEKNSFSINFIPLRENNFVQGTRVTLTLPLKIANP